MPSNVQRGQGICITCAWSSQDVLYLVQDPDKSTVKFGITSGDPKARLGNHARDGFTAVLALRQGLPQGAAFAAEQNLIKRLKARGVQPVRGREYFDATYAPFILSMLDEYLR